MTLRPDESANLAMIERDKRFREKAGTAAKVAATTAVGVGLAGKILPLLSSYVPEDLALKGISKLAPKIGDFLKRGVSLGLGLREGLDYLKKELEPKENIQPEQKNIIEKHSPDLHNFIKDLIQKGRSPVEAGALAQLQGKDTRGFNSIINQIIKAANAPWSAIVESVYGPEGTKTTETKTPQPGSETPKTAKGPSDKWGAITKSLKDLLEM